MGRNYSMRGCIGVAIHQSLREILPGQGPSKREQHHCGHRLSFFRQEKALQGAVQSMRGRETSFNQHRTILRFTQKHGLLPCSGTKLDSRIHRAPPTSGSYHQAAAIESVILKMHKGDRAWRFGGFSVILSNRFGREAPAVKTNISTLQWIPYISRYTVSCR